jgi:hypothetical protein
MADTLDYFPAAIGPHRLLTVAIERATLPFKL